MYENNANLIFVFILYDKIVTSYYTLMNDTFDVRVRVTTAVTSNVCKFSTLTVLVLKIKHFHEELLKTTGPFNQRKAYLFSLKICYWIDQF